MIRSHIDSKKNHGVVLMRERFSHLSHPSNRSFELDSPIKLRYLSNLKVSFTTYLHGCNPHRQKLSEQEEERADIETSLKQLF